MNTIFKISILLIAFTCNCCLAKSSYSELFTFDQEIIESTFQPLSNIETTYEHNLQQAIHDYEFYRSENKSNANVAPMIDSYYWYGTGCMNGGGCYPVLGVGLVVTLSIFPTLFFDSFWGI